jgi:hypothetical protein
MVCEVMKMGKRTGTSLTTIPFERVWLANPFYSDRRFFEPTRLLLTEKPFCAIIAQRSRGSQATA